MEKYRNPWVPEEEFISPVTKTSKIFQSCLFPSLMTVEGKLAGILTQKFNYHGD